MIVKFQVGTAERACMIDVTPQVRRAIKDSGVRAGVCNVFVPHTTAGVIVNEGADPAVVDDLVGHFERAVPWGAAYQHREGNSASHIKAAILGQAATVFVEDGDLALGTWQAIFLCEFDGPRQREVWVKVVSD
ncbi:MAG TPA: secondary thiamine-phosphate synthase enzyme YjbQ [Solirubrobacterales bacterium]